MNLIFDQFQNCGPSPNLVQDLNVSARHTSLWHTYPYVVLPRFLDYATDHDFPLRLRTCVDSLPRQSWYPIGIAFYQFDVDYFALLPKTVVTQVKNNQLGILFYYHEGDDPDRQHRDLVMKCARNGLPANCWRFVSANTAAKNQSQFAYFPDHELAYWRDNRRHAPLAVHSAPRPYDFTMLIRTHKWWRATVAADLLHLGVLDRSLWSYGDETIEDDLLDNPIEIDSIPNLRSWVMDFVDNRPYRCDDLNSAAHNQHQVLVAQHFQSSYIHIVIETFFDVDQSQGTFLTEKIFKPIKHGQPFVCVGPAGTLQHLRDLGYKTFDNVLDNSYDNIQNNTQRWMTLRAMLNNLKSQDLHSVFEACRSDIIANQLQFLSSKFDRLRSLEEQLNAS